MNVVRPRVSELRCAFCHDGASSEACPCPGCGTILHSDCWLLLGACPTLGCSITRRPRIVVEAASASPWAVVGWFASFAGAWGLLRHVVPPFDRMFTETGLNLDGPTTALVEMSRVTGTLPGRLVALSLLLASFLAYVRYHRRRGLDRLYHFATAATLVALVIAFVLLCLPRMQTLQKL